MALDPLEGTQKMFHGSKKFWGQNLQVLDSTRFAGLNHAKCDISCQTLVPGLELLDNFQQYSGHDGCVLLR